MREKIAQLERIRELRLQQRQREKAAVKAEHDRTVAAQRQLTAVRQQVYAEYQAEDAAFAQAGETRGEADVTRHQRVRRQIAGHIKAIDERLLGLERSRRLKARQLAEKTSAVKAAEKACEQLEILGEKLEREEAVRAEMLEEMQADPPARRPPEGTSL